MTSRKILAPLFIVFAVMSLAATTDAQKKRATKAPSKSVKPVDELTKLRDEFVKATNEYKSSLEKLRTSYGRNVVQAEERLTRTRALFEQGLVSKREVESDERAVADASAKVNDVTQKMATADTQIAQTLLEAEAETKLAKARIPKGGMIRTAALIRFNGGASFVLSDAWKIQQFFLNSFRRPLPVAVFGQGAIHDRWRLDHRNSIDVSLHPDGAEGQALLNFLRANGIPFLAFRAAIPGTATGPHIHIGRPSHRY